MKNVSNFEVVFQSGQWSLHSELLGTQNGIDVGFETVRKDIDENHIEFTQHFILNVIPKGKKRAAVKIECDIVTTCETEGKQPDSFWNTYERITLPVITVPFFREHAHSLSGKMGIPPIVVPPWTR